MSLDVRGARCGDDHAYCASAATANTDGRAAALRDGEEVAWSHGEARETQLEDFVRAGVRVAGHTPVCDERCRGSTWYEPEALNPDVRPARET